LRFGIKSYLEPERGVLGREGFWGERDGWRELLYTLGFKTIISYHYYKYV
jgi:hypothetical protein